MHPQKNNAVSLENSPQEIRRIQRNNGIYYAIREGCYAAAALFISGT